MAFKIWRTYRLREFWVGSLRFGSKTGPAITASGSAIVLPSFATTDIDAGASGSAGTVDVFPTTAAKGKLSLAAADSAGNTATTVTNASQAGARTYTIPDAGASASFVMTEGAQTVNGNKTLGGSVVRAAQEWQLSQGPKVGSAAGWAVNPAADNREATMAASQTGGILIVPIGGLKVGWTITGFKVLAQVQSVGGTVIIDADLRRETNAASAPTDASVGTITQVSVVAQTAVAAAKTGLTDVVAAGTWYYIKVTGTTAASTTIRLLGCTVTVTEA